MSLRKILYGFSLFFVIIAIGAFITCQYFNPNIYKTQLTEHLSKKLHSRVEIEGDIRWIYSPRLGLEVQKIKIHPDIRLLRSSLAEVNKAKLYVKWTPLLRHQLEVENISLEGIALELPSGFDLKKLFSS